MFAKERLYLKTVNSKLSLKEEELTRGHDGQRKRRVDRLLVPGWTKGLEQVMLRRGASERVMFGTKTLAA